MAQESFTSVIGNQWYILYPCYDSNQPVIFTQAILFNAYLNTTIEVYDNIFLENLGCFTVKLFSGTPPIFAVINNGLTYDGASCDPCIASCITIGGGIGTVRYINYNDVETTTSLPANICTKTKPYVSIQNPLINVISEGCETVGGCNISCYELTNCATGQIINSNNQSLFSAYANNSTISLNELDGCWTVDLGVECDCFQDVSINLIYSSCETCLPIVAYTLTNCENLSLVNYSEEDLSQYVGKIVSLDCGDCWFVEEIDFRPPNTQTFVVENAYDSCEQCSRAYFILYDCAGDLAPITTFTDMTSYGSDILKLAGYPSCWSVQTSPTPDYENAVGVSVTQQYDDCPTCLEVIGCTCTKVKNTTSEPLTYTYKDCSDVEQTFTLAPGATSAKRCVNQWILIHLNTDIVTEYGECVEDPNDSLNKICPVDITGRMMRPGYTTPNCDPERFEKITCETAEVLYRQVLQQRYGISNCCPDDDERLIVNKEVIDLQALNDPDFNCTQALSCCAPADCGCGNCKSQ